MLTLNESGVIFDAAAHTYHLDGRELQGITGTLINRAYPKAETYRDVDEATLRHAADRGTACHTAVETYSTLGMAPDGFEEITGEAARLLKSQGLKVERTEYVVTDYKHYASPIDLLCTDADGRVCIVDMKFTAKLHYEQVRLQTSIYRRFFHLVNPDLQAERLFVLYIHTNDTLKVLDSGIYEMQPVDAGAIDALIDADQAGAHFDIAAYYGGLPERVNAVEDYLCQLDALIAEKTAEMQQIKDGLCALMLKNGIKSYESRRLKLSAIMPKPRRVFDSARFKAERPDEYAAYSKEQQPKPSVRITVKK